MPKPAKGESEGDFVSRFVQARRHEGKKEDIKQSVAIAYEVYRKHKGKKSKPKE